MEKIPVHMEKPAVSRNPSLKNQSVSTDASSVLHPVNLRLKSATALHRKFRHMKDGELALTRAAHLTTEVPASGPVLISLDVAWESLVDMARSSDCIPPLEAMLLKQSASLSRMDQGTEKYIPKQTRRYRAGRVNVAW